MLLFRRTKLLGAVLLTPVFINIILLDILYKINQGALLNAIVFQSVFILIFIQQRKKIIRVFKTLLLDDNSTITQKQKWIKFALATLIAIGMFFGYQVIT